MKKQSRQACFNADTVRKELQNRKQEIQKAIEAQKKKEMRELKAAINKRIAGIPERIKASLQGIAQVGLPNECVVLTAGNPEAGYRRTREEILDLLAVKEIIKWAEKRNFGYKISVTNTYWELYLTW